MERICVGLENRIMSAEEAAGLIQSGMTLGMSGFTLVGYPKAVPRALAKSRHAKELTVCIGASAGDELDGAMVRAGLVKRRYSYQSNRDMRTAINSGLVGYSDMHISQFPLFVNQGVGPRIDVAVVECTAITEDGLIPTASVGSTDAVIRAAEKVIVEVNQTLPMGLCGMHDIYEVGVPPQARPIPILSPLDRIGTTCIPCPKEKIAAIVLTDTEDQPAKFKSVTPVSRQVGAKEKLAAIVLTDTEDQPAKFKPVTPVSRQVGDNVVSFLKEEIAAGRLPRNPGPIQSGVGSVGNAVLQSLSTGGFRGLTMYTEVMQDAALSLLEEGVFSGVSASAVSLEAETRKRFYREIDRFRGAGDLKPSGGHPPPGCHCPEHTHRSGSLRKCELHPHYGDPDHERDRRQRRLYTQCAPQHLCHGICRKRRSHFLHCADGLACGSYRT